MTKASSTGVTYPKGFRAAGGTCGIKPSGKPDLAMIVADGPCAAAGVFTTNKMPGAPVIVSRRHVRSGSARAIVCNSGVSNVCTGQAGIDDAVAMCRAVAGPLGVKPGEVLVCSTGVIGHRLPMDKITRGIATLLSRLSAGRPTDAQTARAIMTTDLVPKSASATITIAGREVRIGGIAKGSGMIAPNMATMLSFITTDAAIAPAVLRKALKRAADHSFNRMSIDHDTSTSDSVLILASGLAGNPRIDTTGTPGKHYDAFEQALTEVCDSLAYQIVRDGEGATKVFRVQVQGARSQRDADLVGRTIVGSPLVKTAVHGGDPNWGRLVMAVGRSGAAVKPEKLNLYINGIHICRNGAPADLDTRTMRKLVSAMRKKEITFGVNLGIGSADAEWLGCDLSRQYVAINADYTT